MKKLLWVAFPLVFIVIAIFSPDQPRARADHSSTTIMSEQAVVGPGTASVSSQVTPTEGGSDRHSFQYHATATGIKVAIQQSADGGTTWAQVYLFGPGGPDEIWSTPACGACIFRAYKIETTTETATIVHNVSGVTVPLAPTYTATVTPTVTPTSTNTPTVTPTATITNTPTVTPTATVNPLAITPTPTPSLTPTPTRTPTVTPTNTPSTYGLTVDFTTGTGKSVLVQITDGGSMTCLAADAPCVYNITTGKQVTATATAADFATWTATGGAAACDTSTSNVCIFNMTATTSLTANY